MLNEVGGRDGVEVEEGWYNSLMRLLTETCVYLRISDLGDIIVHIRAVSIIRKLD